MGRGIMVGAGPAKIRRWDLALASAVSLTTHAEEVVTGAVHVVTLLSVFQRGFANIGVIVEQMVVIASTLSSQISCAHFRGLQRLGSASGRSHSALSTFYQPIKFHARFSAATVTPRSRIVSMAGSGRFLVGGNWKCNGTKESITKLVADLNNANFDVDVDVIVAPPLVYIDQVKNSLMDRIEISAQNCWVGKGGAFTGETSAEQLKDLGCNWVILGHSERRHIIGEDDQFIGRKAAYALSQKLKVIACIGEKLEERESGKTFDVCFQQLKAFADHVPIWNGVVIAYEPVWAIGTGKVATFQQAQEVHAAIRDWLKKLFSDEIASNVRIIYGGSVNGSNCTELAKQQDVDGFLVGGASLKAQEFTAIVNSLSSKKAVA